MPTKTWQLQEAKSHFSDLVNTAIRDGAQTITKHGKPAVVVISAEEYRRQFGPKKSLAEALCDCPESLGDLLGKRTKRVARSIDLK